MTAVSFIGDHDEFGRPRRTATVALPRRVARRGALTAAAVGTLQPDVDRVLATDVRTTYAVSPPGTYIHDRVAEKRTFELVTPPPVAETAPNDLRRVLADQMRGPPPCSTRSTPPARRG